MSASAVVSIHDVRPSTLVGVEEVAELLSRLEVRPVTLLLVPGADWDDHALDRVRGLVVGHGYTVAGHGWSHRAVHPASVGHRLHAKLLSRNQAEHLSRSREELVSRVRRCHGWFKDVGLPTPELYVPPAWAMGKLARSDLEALPFTWYEVLTGYVVAASGSRVVAPLVGFEADTRRRDLALRASNLANRGIRRIRGPLRIAIHPWDLRLRLSGGLERLLRRDWCYGTAEAVLRGRRPIRAGSARPEEV